MSVRATLSQEQKHRSYAKAFRTIEEYRTAGNHLAAFVLAFSIFEDRLSASVMLASDISGTNRPKGFLRMYTMINRLESDGHISTETSKGWKAAGDQRNELIHAAIWQLDIFTDEHVSAAIALARSADRIASKLRRQAVS